MSSVYATISLPLFCILPNHLHLILFLQPDESGRTQFAPTIPQVIKQFKGAVTKHSGCSIWQKSFHDHVIRSEKELLEVWQYIQENPVKLDEDSLTVR